jgi:RNA polymerase sigma factor (sigma-70 family)
MHPVSPEMQERFEARLAQARAGSSQAFDDLVLPFKIILRRYARKHLERRLQRKFSDSDLCQITLVKAFEDLHEFQGSTFEEFGNWLLGIMDHTISEQSRMYHRPTRDVAREISLEEIKDRLPIQQEASDEENERSSLLKRALQFLPLLPTLYRKVIDWRFFKNRSYKAIGRHLGLSADAAKHLCYRALEMLRKKLRER